MATTPTNRLPEFITDGGIETHIIFNMGVDLPHFSAFPLNDSATGREVIRRYYRDYLPVARAAGRGFLFAPIAGVQVLTGPIGLVMIGRF